MAWARTVAVVVPSPATSEVFEATSRTICAPMFSSESFSSISLATVTPSLVMTGEPNFLLITTLRPLGPSVTFTASARTLTPRRIAWRDSSPCTINFGIAHISYQKFFPHDCGLQNLFNSPKTKSIFADVRLAAACGCFFALHGFRRAAEDAEDLFFLEDQEFFTVNLDVAAGVFSEQDAIALFHAHGNMLAFVILSGADRHNNTFLWFLFCRVRNDDASAHGFSFLYATHQNSLSEWS